MIIRLKCIKIIILFRHQNYRVILLCVLRRPKLFSTITRKSMKHYACLLYLAVVMLLLISLNVYLTAELAEQTRIPIGPEGPVSPVAPVIPRSPGAPRLPGLPGFPAGPACPGLPC